MAVAKLQTTDSRAAASERRIELVDLVARMARELDWAGAVADDCQDAIGEISEHNFRHGDVVRLQALDGLTQTLFELAGLCRRLSVMPDLGDEEPELW